MSKVNDAKNLPPLNLFLGAVVHNPCIITNIKWRKKEKCVII